jgi:transcription initiation factor IIE alpha subunit
MRTVFEEPTKKTNAAIDIERIIKFNPQGLTEKQISSLLGINRRTIRKIIEKLNKRKYIGHNNSIKYHAILVHEERMFGPAVDLYKYFMITPYSPHKKTILKKKHTDVVAAIKSYKMYLDDLRTDHPEDRRQIGMMEDLVNSLEII